MKRKGSYSSTDTVLLWAKQDPAVIVQLEAIINGNETETKKNTLIEQFIRMNIPLNVSWKYVKKELKEHNDFN